VINAFFLHSARRNKETIFQSPSTAKEKSQHIDFVAERANFHREAHFFSILYIVRISAIFGALQELHAALRKLLRSLVRGSISRDRWPTN